MDEKKEKEENNIRKYLFNQRTKIIIIALVLVIGNNIKLSKKIIIRNRKNNSYKPFKPLVKKNKDFKTIILNKNKNKIKNKSKKGNRKYRR